MWSGGTFFVLQSQVWCFEYDGKCHILPVRWATVQLLDALQEREIVATPMVEETWFKNFPQCVRQTSLPILDFLCIFLPIVSGVNKANEEMAKEARSKRPPGKFMSTWPLHILAWTEAVDDIKTVPGLEGFNQHASMLQINPVVAANFVEEEIGAVGIVGALKMKGQGHQGIISMVKGTL